MALSKPLCSLSLFSLSLSCSVALLHSPWQFMAFVWMPETIRLQWICRGREVLCQSGTGIRSWWTFYIFGLFYIPTILTSLFSLTFWLATLSSSPPSACRERWPANCHFWNVPLKHFSEGHTTEEMANLQRTSVSSYSESSPPFLPCRHSVLTLSLLFSLSKLSLLGD